MNRAVSMFLAAPVALLVVAVTQSPHAVAGPEPVGPLASSAGSARPPGHISVVQAVPGIRVDVVIDGAVVSEETEVGAVLGPYDLEPGEHTVTFTNASLDVDSTLDVATGASTDVVLHLPAAVAGEPIVHSYAAPTEPIGPDKARVVLAHTATVAPADVEVNGTTVFTNIANGEFAEAELPAGTHEVALLPTGKMAKPILGPLDVSLDPRTLSMLYAYGNPTDGSMNVIAHVSELAPDGSVEPTTIRTGSVGLAADIDLGADWAR